MSISPEQQLNDFGYQEIPIEQVGNGKPKKVMEFSNIVSLSDIMATNYPDILWAIDGYLPEGFSVLAGRQKLGKTWLALDWSLAVATGGFAMGQIDCQQGDVLYLDLENGHRRIKSRIERIFPNEQPNLSNIQIVTEAPELDKGCIDCLESWRKSVSKPKLVVIDVLQRVKPSGKANRNAYENDYAIFAELQAWATNNGIAVLGLHHTRKGGADDPLEALSGSNGLSACADTTLVLDKDQNGMTIYVRGRDVEEKETALRHDVGIWTVLGDAAEVNRSDERVTIAVTLEKASEPMSPTLLADVTGMKNGNVRKLLHHMYENDEVLKIGRGKYIHPKNEAKFLDLKNTGNNGNKVTIGKEKANA